jgi:proteic killer suppression protein
VGSRPSFAKAKSATSLKGLLPELALVNCRAFAFLQGPGAIATALYCISEIYPSLMLARMTLKRYIYLMIISFGDRATEDLYNGLNSKESRKIPSTIVAVALRKLDMINAAHRPEDLKAPPGNRLEHLKGDRSGYYSIRINDRFRIIFRMTLSNAYEAQIVDYH